MVTNVTSLTGNGLKDWLIQRITAIYFALYGIFLFGFILLHPNLGFSEWHILFQQPTFRVATTIAILAMVFHTWVGIWTVTTDYIKCTMARLTTQSLVLLLLLVELIWGLMMVWGHI